MDPSTLRKKQIASRLGVSVQVLEQYLQAKRAEVLQPKTGRSGGPAEIAFTARATRDRR